MSRLITCILLIVCVSCKQGDEQKLIGKWKAAGEIWFDFLTAEKYSGGVYLLTEQKEQLYSINTKDKTLTLYNKENGSYLLKYRFKGKDTLQLSNYMNTIDKFTDYIRIEP